MAKNRIKNTTIVVIELATCKPKLYGNLKIASELNKFEIGIYALRKRKFPIELDEYIIYQEKIIKSKR